VFPSKGVCLQVVYKSYGLLGWLMVVHAAAVSAVPTQLITLILFTNWCYTQKCLR